MNDELQYIANSSNAAVIGISKSKLDESIFQSEMKINNYDLLYQDGGGGGVACYIRVSEKGVINIGLSDHQVVFCTQKTSKFKTGVVCKHINLCSLKNYRIDDYKKSLAQ